MQGLRWALGAAGVGYGCTHVVLLHMIRTCLVLPRSHAGNAVFAPCSPIIHLRTKIGPATVMSAGARHESLCGWLHLSPTLTSGGRPQPVGQWRSSTATSEGEDVLTRTRGRMPPARHQVAEPRRQTRAHHVPRGLGESLRPSPRSLVAEVDLCGAEAPRRRGTTPLPHAPTR